MCTTALLSTTTNNGQQQQARKHAAMAALLLNLSIHQQHKGMGHTRTKVKHHEGADEPKAARLDQHLHLKLMASRNVDAVCAQICQHLDVWQGAHL